MRKIIVILSILLIAEVAVSQLLPGGSERDINYSDSSFNSMDKSFFIDVGLKASDYSGSYGYDMGIRIGGFYKRNLSVSIGMNYLLSQNIDIGDKGEFLSLIYGGVNPEFVVQLPYLPRIYAGVGAYVGFGYADYNIERNVIAMKPPSGEWFIIAEPSVNLYGQITKDIVISASAGKRIANNFELLSMDRKMFQGYFGMLTFRVLMYSE